MIPFGRPRTPASPGGLGEPMKRKGMQWGALMLALAATATATVRGQATKYEKPQAYQIVAEDRQALEGRTAELERAVATLPRGEGAPQRDALADVAVYAKA